MKNRHLLVYLLLCLTAILASQQRGSAQNQKQYNHWYFGKVAGLNFSGGTPILDVNGALSTLEGSAVYSDPNTGELLFYTDGSSVWDSTHTQMPNGNLLHGHNSSTQSALIVPDPGDSNKYYLFTADQGGYIGPSFGLNYSKVDMTLNGGKGNVTNKNTFLLAPATEKLTATKHCNGRDYWVLGHGWNNNRFIAWLITPNGIADTVVSPVGNVHQGVLQRTIGYMKFSPNARQLASVVYNMSGTDTAQVFDFNPSTGIVSNPISLPVEWESYGVSFSPDNTKLYVSSATLIGFPTLIQFDLIAGSVSDIIASKTTLSSSIATGALQIGPDDRIYVALNSTNFIGVIQDPNQAGLACNYIDTGIILDTANIIGIGESQWGLPNNIDYNPDDSILIDFFYEQTTCTNFFASFQMLGGTVCDTTLEFRWDFGDGTAQDTTPNPTHLFPQAGSYTVKLHYWNATVTDSVVKLITITPNRFVDLAWNLVCEGYPVSFQEITNCSPTAWRWDFGDGSLSDTTPNPMHTYANAGSYQVQLIAGWADGYKDSITKMITILPDSGITNFSIDNLCHRQVLLEDASIIPAIDWLWDFGDASPFDSTVSVYHTYAAIDTFQVTYYASFDHCSPDTITKPVIISTQWHPTYPASICAGNTVLFQHNYTGDTSDVQVTHLNIFGVGDWWYPYYQDSIEVSILQPGTYPVYMDITHHNGTCMEFLQDTIQVGGFEPFTMDINFSESCPGDPFDFSFDPNLPNIAQYWNFGDGSPMDSSLAPTHTYDTTGLYDIELTLIDSLGCTRTTTHQISILEGVYASFTVFGDTSCTNEFIGLVNTSSGNIQFYQWDLGDGATSTAINVDHAYDDPGTYTIQLQLSNVFGCKDTFSKEVVILEEIPITLSANASICEGDTFQLEASGGSTYHWAPSQFLSDPFIANPLAYPNITTFYQVIVSQGNCSTSGGMLLSIIPPPESPLHDSTICKNGSTTLINPNPNSTATWSTGETADTIILFEAGDHSVTITQNGCELTFPFHLEEEDCDTYIPNAFSPNGDLSNETFDVKINPLEDYHIQVFNRWGNLVFESTDITDSWNGRQFNTGTPLNTGVYFYVIRYERLMGLQQNATGFIHLVR